jgi:ABC-type uncharacterized transport system ATPase subunit
VAVDNIAFQVKEGEIFGFLRARAIKKKIVLLLVKIKKGEVLTFD